MKILFVCDWDYTLLWEKVAIELKERGVLGDALAVIVGRNFKDYLDKNPSNPFSHQWYLPGVLEAKSDESDDVLRLRVLEKRYANPTLWRYLWADRSFIHHTFASSCSKLVRAFDFYEKLYSEERPDLVLAAGYGSMPHLVGHFVARQMGIPMLYPIHSRVGNSYIPGYDALESIIWELPIANNNQIPLQEEAQEEVERFLMEFRNRPERPAYEAVNDRMHGVDWGHFFRFFRYAYRYWISGVYAKDHTKPNPIKKIWLEARPKIRRRLLKDNKIWEIYNPKMDYVYFPLHLQPEASTMSLAPFYLDQPSIIENLAKSVPIGYRVVVKEHPQMLGRRPKRYYEHLKSITNVVLIPPLTDNFPIIRNAKLIFTVTGTAGMEGVVFGKPVITLGSVIYNQCKLVKYAGDIAPTMWADAIREALLNHRHDEDVLKEYLHRLFASATKFWFVEPLAAPNEVLSSENVNRISSWVVNELEKISASETYGRPKFTPRPTIWGA